MIEKSNLLETISNTKKLNVLYVEDNQTARQQAIKMFSNYFDFIDIAVDGVDGLESYSNYFYKNNKYYDLVISDISMPNMDGIEMSKEIYKININQKIIIISAYDDKKYLLDLINMKVESFIQKPLSFEQISNVFKNLSTSLIDNNTIHLSLNCKYNNISKEFLIDNKKVNLTSNEYKFIEFLIKNNKSNTNIEDIFNYIFYDEPFKEFSTNSIKSLVKRLRKKLPEGLITHNKTTGYCILIN